MDKTKKKGNIIILLIGIVFFVAFYFATSFVNRFIAQGLETGKIAQQDAIAYRNINGIFSQLQVLAAIVMVLFDRKRGFIVAIILEVLVAFNLLRSVIFSHNYMPLPGFFTALVSILIITVIYITLQRNDKLHEEVTVNYEKLIEQNHMIEAKDKALTKLAYYDRLTGLPNSAFYNEKLQEYIDSNTSFAMIYMDMDNFKQINDTFGHECGDDLIKVYAERFENYCGSKYTCAKVGGDEFAMILPNDSGSKMTEADVLNIVEQLRALFAEPVQMRSGAISITMSYGICGFPNDGRTPEALVNAADTALYNAKIGGKNRPCFFSQNSLD